LEPEANNKGLTAYSRGVPWRQPHRRSGLASDPALCGSHPLLV